MDLNYMLEFVGYFTALSEFAMSQIPVFSAERAAKIQRIEFSQPLEGQVSQLNGTGDLASTLSCV